MPAPEPHDPSPRSHAPMHSHAHVHADSRLPEHSHASSRAPPPHHGAAAHGGAVPQPAHAAPPAHGAAPHGRSQHNHGSAHPVVLQAAPSAPPPAAALSPPPPSGYQVRLTNVPPELTARDLAEAFGEVSQSRVESVDLLRDGSGRATGEGTIVFNTMPDAHNAVRRYHGGDLNGRRLQVVYEGEVQGTPRR